MAVIEPFRAIRYGGRYRNALDRLLAPPYDVIDESFRRKLHERDPHNVIRLEYGYDTSSRDRYAESAALWHQWQREGVLEMDARPAYYLYEQEFQLPEGVHLPRAKAKYTRRACFAAVALEPFGKGTIFPHERTLRAPKADRLRLISECQANISPVFGILSDEGGEFEELLGQLATTRKPLMRVHDECGETHTLWRLDTDADVAQVRRALRGRTIVIADGHHRYETALAYRDRLRSAAKEWREEHPANRVLMALASDRSENLVILPIHRLIGAVEETLLDRFSQRLREHYEVVTFRLASDSLDGVLKGVFASSGTTFGFYLGGDVFLEARRKRGVQGEGSLAQRLDVAQLHTEVLRPLLGVDTDNPAEEGRVWYTIRADEALSEVRQGRAALAAFVKPPTVKEMEKVALSGETMPQKSTYFYPKLPTGLVMRRVDAAGS